MNIQGWFPLGFTGLISLQSKGLSGVLSTTIQKSQFFFWHSAFFMVHLSYPHMTTEINIALTIWTFVGKVMSLLLNMLSRFVIVLLPRSKHLIILWLQSPSAMILQLKKIKSIILYTFFSSTKWSRAKANRVLPRECIGHSKYSLPRRCFHSANCVTHTVKQWMCMECLSGWISLNSKILPRSRLKMYTADNIKCSRLNNAPFKIYTFPGHQNVTLFGNRIFVNVISKLTWGPNWIRVGSNPITAMLIKIENRDNFEHVNTEPI